MAGSPGANLDETRSTETRSAGVGRNGALPGVAGAEPSSARAPVAGTSAAAPPRKPRFSLRTFQSLSDPNYRWFFASMLGHFAGMNLQMFIRGYIVFHLTDSYAALGIVSLAQAIPGLLFSLTGGVLADRVRSKKMLVQVTTALNIANVFTIGVLIATGNIRVEHLYIAAAAHGAVMSTMMPARQVLTTEVVGLDRLMNALALNNASMNVNRLLMPAAGGFLLAAIGGGTGIGGAEYVYFTMAALYVLSMLTLFPIRVPDRDISTRPRATTAVVLSELGAGFRYMRHEPTVRMLLIINFLLVVGTMPYQMMLPGFALDVIGTDSAGLGILLSVQGIGSLVGALVLASLPSRHRGMILLISSGFLGFTLLAFSWSTWFWISAGILIAVGVGQSGRMSMSQVLVQSYSDPQYRGRVQSIYMMEMSLMQLSVFVVGLLANWIGPQWAIGGTAVLTLAVVTYSLALVPALRRLQ